MVLSAITRDNLPFVAARSLSSIQNITSKNKDQYLDHERFAAYLEVALTSHFMYREKDLSLFCVSGNKMAVGLEEAISPKFVMDPVMLSMIGAGAGGKSANSSKKSPGYVIYVAYRLKRYNPSMHFSVSITSMVSKTVASFKSRKAARKAAEKSARQSMAEKRKGGSQEMGGAGSDKNDSNQDNYDKFSIRQRKFSRDIMPGIGTGEYVIEDLKDHEYGRAADNKDPSTKTNGNAREEHSGSKKAKMAQEEDDIDEKLLEELENKHLLFKFESLQMDYQNVRERISNLQRGEVTIDNRLSVLEIAVTDLQT